jgi:hypothetical protein
MKRIAIVVAAFLAAPLVSNAASITYDVSWRDGTGDSLTGTITTDGTLGSIGVGDINAWAFTSLGSQPFSSSSALAGASLNFNGSTTLVATSTTLSFDFQDTSAFDRVLFDVNTSTGNNTSVGLFSQAWETDGAYGETWQKQGNLSIQVSPSSDVIATAPVPLPASTWLILSGVGGLGVFARRKRAA